MADFTATFEAGVNGNAVTTGAGEASATAWAQVSGTITYDTTHVAHGTLAAKIGGGSDFMRWDLSPVDSYGRVYLYATANPTSATDIVGLYNGGAGVGSVNVMTDGKVRSSVPGQGIITSTLSIALNQWVRVEYHYVVHASAGLLDVKFFNSADSTTETETVSNGSLNTSGLPLTVLYHGDGAIVGTWGSNFWMDDIVANATSYPGPAAPAVTPAVDVLSMQSHVFGHNMW